MFARERAPENGHPGRRPCPEAGMELECERASQKPAQMKVWRGKTAKII